MLDKIPTKEELVELIGEHKYNLWVALCNIINSTYDMECTWNNGGKKWIY